MVIGLSLLVAIGGVLVYALSGNPKVAEMGRIAYAMGLLVFLFQAREVVSLLGGLMIYSTMVSRVMIGIFSYWIGFRFRDIGAYWTIDLGYLKLMIARKER